MDVVERIKAMSVPENATIREAMRAINQGGLGMALIVDSTDGHFCGLVTDGDLRRAILNGHGIELSVAKITRPKPITASVGTSAEEIASVLNERIRCVPILDEKKRVIDLAILDRRMHLPVAEPFLGEKELQYTTECVITGWVSSAGKFVSQFEEMFADFCGVRYAIATCNGTAALHLALLSLDVGSSDEVIVPTLTFIATANAVMYTGACPVFVDSEKETWNISPEHIEEAITPQTKAIIPVHLYGHPANMDPILYIANRHGLAVIEDAAEAHGACYKNQHVGSIGDVGCFSFYGNKIITTGEGGMVVTDRSDLAERIRILRDHGMSPEQRYWHSVMGYNYRMTNLQAALGVAQMEKIDTILKTKRRIAEDYTDGLRDIPGIILPPKAPWAENVYWLYSILVDKNAFGIGRDDLMTALQSHGIETRHLFPPVHSQPIYKTGQSLPVAEQISSKGLSLPSQVNLKKDDIEFVVRTIKMCRQINLNSDS